MATPETLQARTTTTADRGTEDRGTDATGVAVQSVDTVGTGSTSGSPVAKPGGCGKDGKCRGCDRLRPAIREAVNLATKAVADLRAKELTMRTRGALLLHFRTDADEARRVVSNRFEAIAKRLLSGDDYFRSDGKCKSNQIAYTGGSPTADVYLCDEFFDEENDVQRGSHLIHELAHNFGATKNYSEYLRRELPELFGYLDTSQLQHEVYKHNHEYRALDAKDALATADAYRFFALDNALGAGWSILLATGEVRAGLARLTNEAQLSITLRGTAEVEPRILNVFSVVLGAEVRLDVKSRNVTITAAATAGVQIQSPLDPIYLDVRGGVFLSRGSVEGQFGGHLWDASVHFHQGVFDISAFWQECRPFIERYPNRSIIGVGFNVKDIVDLALQ